MSPFGRTARLQERANAKAEQVEQQLRNVDRCNMKEFVRRDVDDLLAALVIAVERLVEG